MDRVLVQSQTTPFQHSNAQPHHLRDPPHPVRPRSLTPHRRCPCYGGKLTHPAHATRTKTRRPREHDGRPRRPRCNTAHRSATGHRTVDKDPALAPPRPPTATNTHQRSTPPQAPNPRRPNIKTGAGYGEVAGSAILATESRAWTIASGLKAGLPRRWRVGCATC